MTYWRMCKCCVTYLLIVFGLQSSRPFLGPSQHVTVYTDHVSATYLQTLKASRGLLYRLALKLEEFQPNIQFLPGKSNIYADYMSRYATPKTQTTPCIQPLGDTDSDIEEFHEVILPLSDQASIIIIILHLRTQHQHTSKHHLRHPSVSHYIDNKITDPGTSSDRKPILYRITTKTIGLILLNPTKRLIYFFHQNFPI